MNRPLAAPACLEQFETSFSQMLRAPLDRRAGRLQARARDYSAELCDAARPGPALGSRERLAVYNRQYWFRLFGVLQHEFPLTTALAGPWAINGLAAQFLAQTPPRHPDLAQAADGFAEFLAAQSPETTASVEPELARIPLRALVQAAQVDQAFRAVFRAPEQPVWRPSAAEVVGLSGARLRWSEAVCLIDEDWPLLRLREEATRARAVVLPAQHADGAQCWAVCQTPLGQRVVALSPVQARLMRGLQRCSVADAFAQLEAACTPEARRALITHTARWLGEAVRHGFWTGLVA